jgi:hypothetical protein
MIHGDIDLIIPDNTYPSHILINTSRIFYQGNYLSSNAENPLLASSKLSTCQRQADRQYPNIRRKFGYFKKIIIHRMFLKLQVIL